MVAITSLRVEKCCNLVSARAASASSWSVVHS